ncbi:MAG TPA: cation diffusion facilitator family transporter [Roseiflexaceae bacterium]|nr:cation diffusion facilitator family transporter [Roseiflexaceae bacterium]
MAHIHDHHSHHGHHHHHHGEAAGRAFAIGVLLNIAFVAAEAAAGYLSGSLALIADAGHNLSDVLGLLLAWGAALLARRRPSGRHTYGMRRATILAALANAVTLLVVVGGIAWEALRRFGEPQPVAGALVIGTAAAGILVNGATALLFLAGRTRDLNVRGAFLHMAADAGVSLGVVVSGLAMLLTGWAWLDPAVSLAVAGVILVGSWGLLRESVDLALDAVPQGVDASRIRAYLGGLPDVRGVHDLHVWALSTTETALTAHLVVAAGHSGDGLLHQIRSDLHDRFGVEHATLQVETLDCERCCGRG